MATTIHEPPKKVGLSRNGGGNWRNLIPAGEGLRAVDDRSSEPARTGIWVGLAAITMSFAAFTSALLVREGSEAAWRHIVLPSILYFNTLVLLASSVTLELGRRRVAAFMTARGSRSAAMRWLSATFFLGILFVIGQYVAWLQLRSQGLYLATNPSSSFFYVFTAVHAVHVLGGLGGLLRVMRKLGLSNLRRSTLDATSYYWHFMGILWVYLLFVLWLKV